MEYKKTKEIRDFIITNVESHPRDIASFAGEKFNISRQAINKHLHALVEKEVLQEIGKTRSKIYRLLAKTPLDKEYNRSDSLSESSVYYGDILPVLNMRNITEKVEQRCSYCFTEIFNNAIDHSQANTIYVKVSCDAQRLYIWIYDMGIGIFKNIKEKYGLDDEQDAVLELSKGKLTTSPQNHSGQGIFFSSRIADRFQMRSHHLNFQNDEIDNVPSQIIKYVEGTEVLLEFIRDSERTSKEVFDKFSSGDDYGFNITHVPVNLAKAGEENLISRSQAKRLLARLDKFTEVALDFTGVSMVGQAFADEIFRVFQNAHPDIRIYPVNANIEVTQMINRAIFERRKNAEE